MVSPTLLASRPRGRRRIVAAVLVILAAGIPFALTFSTLWSTTGVNLSVAQAERDGVTYLRPLVRLISATADAQSAAVAGHPIDQAALATAVADVNDVDSKLGASLGASRRWADISTHLSALRAAGARGAAAYTGYTEATDLELALVAAVGDTSNLILDPALDSYYLMDTTLLRIPASLVTAGRMVDLAALSSSNALRIEALRVQVGIDAAAVDTGIRKSLSSTQSAALGPQLLPSLDRLREGYTAMAPPVGDVAAATATRTSAQDVAARSQIRTAGLAMESAALGQLDGLLLGRIDVSTAQRRQAIAATVGGAAVLLLLWGLSTRRRRGVPEPALDPAAAPAGGDALVEARELVKGSRR